MRPRGTAQRGLVELENRGLFSCNEGSIQPEGNARHRMAANLVELRCPERTGQQEIHELGPRKTKRGIKISRRGIKSEPACGMKSSVNSLKVPSFDTVRLASLRVKQDQASAQFAAVHGGHGLCLVPDSMPSCCRTFLRGFINFVATLHGAS
jgi:hypothetical protein